MSLRPNQIKSRTISNGMFEWGGTPASTNYAHNGLNQMTSAGGSAIGYDLRGNLNSDGWTTYGYDIHNRLTGLSSGASLSYDSAGRLWQVISGANVTTRYLHSGSVVAGEYDENNNIRRRYVHGPGTDEPLVWYEGTGTATRYYLLSDERGSVVSVTDSAGNQSATNTYNEFGVPGASNVGRFQYTGQMWMPEVGLYYYKARFYSPTIGRFLQPDPIGYDDGMNLYAYASNDPVNLSDPTGSAAEYYRRYDEEVTEVVIKGLKNQRATCPPGLTCVGSIDLAPEISNPNDYVEVIVIAEKKKKRTVPSASFLEPGDEWYEEYMYDIRACEQAFRGSSRKQEQSRAICYSSAADRYADRRSGKNPRPLAGVDFPLYDAPPMIPFLRVPLPVIP